MSENNKRTSRISILTVLGAALATFFVSALWYMAFSDMLASLNEAYVNDQSSPSPWIMLVEFGRSIVVVLSLYYLVIKCGISHWKGSLKLGVFLWIFPAFILLGSIIHENYPVGLALIHAGDWLVKLIVVSVIVGWRHQKS